MQVPIKQAQVRESKPKTYVLFTSLYFEFSLVLCLLFIPSIYLISTLFLFHSQMIIVFFFVPFSPSKQTEFKFNSKNWWNKKLTNFLFSLFYLHLNPTSYSVIKAHKDAIGRWKEETYFSRRQLKEPKLSGVCQFKIDKWVIGIFFKIWGRPITFHILNIHCPNYIQPFH